jgi:hypothetical protein
MTDHAKLADALRWIANEPPRKKADGRGLETYASLAARMREKAMLVLESYDAAEAAPREDGDLVERGAILRVCDEWLRSQYLKLHAGEMSAQEERTVKAVINAIRRQVISLDAVWIKEDAPDHALSRAPQPDTNSWLDIVGCPTDGSEWQLRLPDGSQVIGKWHTSVRRWYTRTGPEKIKEWEATGERMIWAPMADGIYPSHYRLIPKPQPDTVTDEMVEAASRAVADAMTFTPWADREWSLLWKDKLARVRYETYARAAITAALAAQTK